MVVRRLRPPLTEDEVRSLRAGERLYIDGEILTGRDAAHRRLCEMMDRGQKLPVQLEGAVIYYVGPCPAKPGQVIGSAGPTTSGRMDPYAPRLIARGLRAMIGKGMRSAEVVEAMKRHGAVYLVAVGGVGALLAKRIKAAEVIAFPELGPEAIYRLRVEDFPVMVGIDANGCDIYRMGREKYRRDRG